MTSAIRSDRFERGVKCGAEVIAASASFEKLEAVNFFRQVAPAFLAEKITEFLRECRQGIFKEWAHS